MPRRLVRIDDDPGSLWGAPALDPAVAATPTSPIAETVTQATQTANEEERAAVAQSQLPPPPFGVPAVDSNGFFTRPWMGYLLKDYRRVGGASVTSATDMDVLTEFDDLPVPPRPVDDVLGWMDSLEPKAQIAMLAQQVDALTGLVLSQQERGFIRQPAMTAAAAAAPAGGTGTAAGGWDTAANRDAAIATLNNLRTRLNEVEAILKSARLV